MKNIHSLNLLCLLFVLFSCNKSQTGDSVVINLREKGASISPSMYGVFFEEINHAGDGGLYAELVQNRSFMEKEMPSEFYAEGNRLRPKPVINHLTGESKKNSSYRWTTDEVPAWKLQANHPHSAQMMVTKENPKFKTAPNNLKVTIKEASEPVLLINEGYWGMNIVEGEKYHLRTIIRTSPNYKGTIKVRLLSPENQTLVSEIIQLKTNGQWNDIKINLKASSSHSKARLALEFDAPGTVWVDYVSLFPEKTFNNRPNGLRKDVAEMLVGLKPAFFRWPGGCVVEGITLDNRFDWKKTLGDPAARPGEYSTWGYRCSYGFGYYEMLQFCEDIGTKAMYVCNVGLGCQFRMGDACPEHDIVFFINDCLDAIEYAIGDVTTTWGARRAADGHPEPFPLQYIEIGNENWGPEYDRRYDMFFKAIKAKYPQLTLIYNEMSQREGPPAIAKTDMIDPHWYVDPYFFLRNTTLFDSYERGKYEVYVGEYAVNKKVGAGNMLGALAEAAFIGGMERNGDLVTMASYAPLLENRNDRAWPTNLIWVDNDRVLGRSSYYVQKMAAENRPDYNVKSSIYMKQVEPFKFDTGHFGFGSHSTSTEFADIKVSKNGVTSVPDINSFINREGNRKADVSSGNLIVNKGQSILLKDIFDGDYTITCKVRSTGNGEGFQFYQCMSEDGQTGFKYNIGIWGSRDRIELIRIEQGKDVGNLADRSSGKEIRKDTWHNVRLVVSPMKSELFVDDELIFSYIPQPLPLQFYHSGYDEKAGELIIKVVNVAETSHAASFKIEGSKEITKTGQIISLAASNGTDENSYEQPEKIYPQESVYDKFGKTVDYEFPPYSYTIMRIKATMADTNSK